MVFCDSLSPSVVATCLSGCAGVFCCRCCCCLLCVFTVAPAMHVHVCAFLEVTGNVINGCEAGSAVKGTWLVFVSTMIPRASKCWKIVLLESAGSGLVVQATNEWYCLLMDRGWVCEITFLYTVHCWSTCIRPQFEMLQFSSCLFGVAHTWSAVKLLSTGRAIVFHCGQQRRPTRQRHCACII